MACTTTWSFDAEPCAHLYAKLVNPRVNIWPQYLFCCTIQPTFTDNRKDVKSIRDLSKKAINLWKSSSLFDIHVDHQKETGNYITFCKTQIALLFIQMLRPLRSRTLSFSISAKIYTYLFKCSNVHICEYGSFNKPRYLQKPSHQIIFGNVMGLDPLNVIGPVLHFCVQANYYWKY